MSDLALTSIEEHGVLFETGRPVTFTFLRNLESAPPPPPSDPYQQHLEPAGLYVLHADPGPEPALPWIWGTATVASPLVLAFSTSGHHRYDEDSWKARLVDHYEATDEALTSALLDDGYDAIVTVRPFRQGFETAEIVLLDPQRSLRTKDLAKLKRKLMR